MASHVTDGRPVNAVNLTAWKQGGYREWQDRHQALELLENLEDEEALGHKSFTGPLSTKLAHFLAVQFAAVARIILAEKNPLTRWARLRELCSDVSRLRKRRPPCRTPGH